MLEPDTETSEMTVVSVHPGVTREQIADATGWPIKFATQVVETPRPTAEELGVLRELHARTTAAFQGKA
jgi:glutaconate CoA-transferase subunit B